MVNRTGQSGLPFLFCVPKIGKIGYYNIRKVSFYIHKVFVKAVYR